jgi:hypothetical protein
MPSSRTFKTIVATRIRLGLLRVRVTVDPQRMLDDPAYAAEVLQQCRQSGVRDLAKLADDFEADAPETQAPHSRQPADTEGGLSTQPGTYSPSVHSSSDPGANSPRDPNDPHHSRTQRYLRGAR